MNITRQELVQQLRENYGYKKKDAVALVDDFCSVILSNMEAGNTVSILGFGCFDFVLRKERAIKDPYGVPCVSPEHWSPKFYPGNSMKRAVKIWEDNQRRGLI